MPEPFNPYLVQAGDTLMSIAQQFGFPLQQLLSSNPGVAQVFPGMQVNTPQLPQSQLTVIPPTTGAVAPVGGAQIQMGPKPQPNPYGVTLGSQQVFRSPTQTTTPQTPYTPSISKDKARGSGESAPYNPQVVGTTPGVLSMNIWTSMTEAERQTLIQNGYTVSGGVVLPPGMNPSAPGTQSTQKYYRAGNGVKGGGQTFMSEQAYITWLKNHKAKEDELKRKRGAGGGIAASNLGVSTG